MEIQNYFSEKKNKYCWYQQFMESKISIKTKLRKVINMMKDLKKLAIEDGTESKLYKGHCIDRIYQLLGDSRITRWLTMICEKDPDDEEVLGRFIDFLKKELRV